MNALCERGMEGYDLLWVGAWEEGLCCVVVCVCVCVSWTGTGFGVSGIVWSVCGRDVQRVDERTCEDVGAMPRRAWIA